jgi:hypothetical protein
MIGDRKWQHGMAIFFAPFTEATTRYFDAAGGHCGTKVAGRIVITWTSGSIEQTCKEFAGFRIELDSPTRCCLAAADSNK